MRLKSRKRRGPAFDVVDLSERRYDRHDRLIPMINVVFLLLTFFLITGTLRISSGPNIELPEFATQGVLDMRRPVLSVAVDGALHFDGRVLEMAEALAAIKAALSDAPDQDLHIKADRNIPASVILPLLQKLRDGGIKSIRLISIKKRE